MDCRTFRHHHCAFVDDVLPGADIVAMELHRVECGRCAEFDAKVRRSLLLVRNLPSVECSADFTERLFERLRETEVDRHSTLARRGPGIGTFAAVAAVMLLATGGALATLDEGRPQDIVLRPVVATTPAPPLSDPFSDPAIAASAASAGMPMWPALLLADELPMHVAQAGFQAVGLRY